MAANSVSSHQNGRRSITRLSQSDVVQIFQQSLCELARVGIQVQVTNGKDNRLVLALHGVQVCQHCRSLYLFEEMAGPGVCQHCAESVPAQGPALPMCGVNTR